MAKEFDVKKFESEYGIHLINPEFQDGEIVYAYIRMEKWQKDVSPIALLTHLKSIVLYLPISVDLSPLKVLNSFEFLNLELEKSTNLDCLKELTQLKKLQLILRNTKDISQIKNLINLEEIIIYSFVDLEDLSQLQYLTNIQKVEIHGCTIKDLSFARAFKKIKQLDLKNNKITDFSPLKDLISLEELLLSSNEINDLNPLQNLTKLRILHLSYNQISDLSSLQNLTNLTYLDLNNNQISDLNPLQNLINLIDLHLNENQIAHTKPLQNLKKLKTLKLTKNKIGENAYQLAELSGLNHLELQNNGIDNINSFNTLTEIITICLNENQISDISAVANFKNMTKFEAPFNQIKDISPLENLEKINIIILNSNLIEDVYCIKKLKRFRCLDVYNNPIKDIIFFKELEKTVQYVTYSKPAREKVSKEKVSAKEPKFAPERIILQGKSTQDYRSALEQLNILFLNIDNLKEHYLAKNPISFCKKENGDLVLIKKYNLKDFITETEKIEELRELFCEFIHNIAIAYVYDNDEGYYLFPKVIAGFAKLKKEYVYSFIDYMKATHQGEGENEEGMYINEIVKTHGFCSETLDLMIGRYIDYSEINDSERFVEKIQGDLGKWLKEDEKNFNMFYQKFVKILGYNAYSKELAEKETKRVFYSLFEDNEEEAQKWVEKVMQEYEKYNAEKEEIENAIKGAYQSGEIEQRKEATKYLNKVLEMKSKHGLQMLSNVYHAIAREYVVPLCGGGKEWNEEFDKALRTGLEYELMALKLSLPIDNNNYKNIKDLISTIYQNLAHSYSTSAAAIKDYETKSIWLEKSIQNLKLALKYNLASQHNYISLSCVLVTLLDMGDRQEQIKKYQSEIEFSETICLNFDKTNKEHIDIYNNAYCVYQRIFDKKNTYKYLEKLLETNKTIKNYKKEYFTEDKDLEFISSEAKFQELMETYFPEKNKAKPVKEKSKTKTVKTESKIDLSGKKVCLTGKAPLSRAEISEILTAQGAIVQDSVNKTTEILICGEEDTESSKAKKAREQGVQIMTYKDVIEF